jgi:hypothetical protein
MVSRSFAMRAPAIDTTTATTKCTARHASMPPGSCSSSQATSRCAGTGSRRRDHGLIATTRRLTRMARFG